MAENKKIKFDANISPNENKSDEINQELKKFMGRITTVQSNTKIIISNNEKLKKLKEELPISIGDRQKIVSNTISGTIEENIILQDKVKNAIQQNFDEFIKDLDLNSNVLEQEKRIARNLHGSTVKHFQDVVVDFQSIESDIKGINQAMIIRSAEIAMNRKLNKDEQETIINNPQVICSIILDGPKVHGSQTSWGSSCKTSKCCQRFR